MWADLSRIRVGDEARAVVRVDAAMIQETARLTGDANPIHVDRDAARLIGQSRPVAHGMILFGVISRLIGTELPGHGSVWFHNDVEFLAPVYEGDEVTIRLVVAQVSPATRVVVMDVFGTTGAATPVARGRVKVRVPEIVVNQERSAMNAEDRVTIVTGGSRGLGRAVVDALASPSARVVIGYRTDRAAADATVAAVRDKGGDAVAVAADLTSGGARQLADAAERAFGRVDAIVHAATPSIDRKPFLDTPADAFRAYFDTYVVGLVDLAQAVLPGMKERRQGRIVAVLSSAIAEAPARLSAYTTGKHALLGLCRSLAVEFGPFNVTVNAVSPSLVVSRHGDDLGAAGREDVARKTPLRRLAEADEVAQVVRFLLSDAAGFVSGVNLPVTGGLLF